MEYIFDKVSIFKMNRYKYQYNVHACISNVTMAFISVATHATLSVKKWCHDEDKQIAHEHPQWENYNNFWLKCL